MLILMSPVRYFNRYITRKEVEMTMWTHDVNQFPHMKQSEYLGF